MKFGETFTEYLGENQYFLNKCSHVEYKRLKKVLKSCRTCRSLHSPSDSDEQQEKDVTDSLSVIRRYEYCTLCDQRFFSELKKEASSISGCFSTRVRHLLHLHVASGMQKYVLRLTQCFKRDQQDMVEQGRMLIEYITMNAIALRKILKKYDKIHGSVNGRNFKSMMRAEHLEFLQSPWMVELGAFYLNFNGPDGVESNELYGQFHCDLDSPRPMMTLRLPDSMQVEYDLTCAVCLDTLFNPYALSCGHLFCKLCTWASASVLILDGLKSAAPEAKCPICRAAGVYADAVHMLELNLLLKRRRKDYWTERMAAERAEILKQSKEYWDLQTKYVIGY